MVEGLAGRRQAPVLCRRRRHPFSANLIAAPPSHAPRSHAASLAATLWGRRGGPRMRTEERIPHLRSLHASPTHERAPYLAAPHLVPKTIAEIHRQRLAGEDLDPTARRRVARQRAPLHDHEAHYSSAAPYPGLQIYETRECVLMTRFVADCLGLGCLTFCL